MGKLIVFEGTDGTGKSTQYARACERLEAQNVRFEKIKFPQYDEPSSALIKMYLAGEFGSDPDKINPYAASTFYAVDRYAGFARGWKDFYDKGGLIVCDRYTTSNAVHQGSKLQGEKQAEFFTWLYDLEYDKMGLPRPDLVLCLDMPTELAHLLREKRDTQGVGDADIREHAERYLARCRETARQAAKHYGWTLISCVKDGRLRSIEDIHEEIYRHIAACLEVEAIAPCDILRRGGVEVQLAGIGGTMIEAGHGITVKADCAVEEADFEHAEMVVLPGGLGGVRSILGCKAAMDAVQKAYDDGKHVAAICAGPTILATLHITDGKTATCYPGCEAQMGSARCVPQDVARDGKVITGRAAGAALDFGLALLSALRGEEAAKEIADAIVYRR